MDKQEILTKLKKFYSISKEYLSEHKYVSAFLTGVVVGFFINILL
jgi:hypothetical protein